MKSFEPGFIEKQPMPQNLLRTIRLLGEFKGKEEVFKQQSPQVPAMRLADLLVWRTSSKKPEKAITKLYMPLLRSGMRASIR